MATRRSRIKGIANIPQRRKVDPKVTDPSSSPPKSEGETTCVSVVAAQEIAPPPVIVEPAPSAVVPEPELPSAITATVKPETVNGATLGESNSVSGIENSALKRTAEPPEPPKPIIVPRRRTFIKPELPLASDVTVKLETVNGATLGESNNVSGIENSAIKPTAEPLEPPKPIIVPRRRTFIKPIVNAKLLSLKSKPKLEVKVNEAKLEETEDVVSGSTKAQNSPDETTILPPPSPIQPLLQPCRPAPNTHSKSLTGSDSEYAAEPLSPTKAINRSRIKAVPRLNQRRTSVTVHGSASESEDDTKKNFKRIRTESSCSNASVTNEPQIRMDPGSPQKSKEFSTIIQRKCKRTEQSRKMAEARRHFVHKFGNKTPDKQKLTMIDLIFYNPNTNPMSQKPKKPLPVKQSEEDTPPATPTSPDPDDIPMESDEENAVPAPQIKIGANGEIVVDEKSLVIENARTKKEREELQKSELIDGDFDTGYGIYKREKRSRDWSKEETLRFYKALNTLGTDFTLMVQLFSGRSRRELKMKFKKEERVNRVLVDKALTRPIEFNIRELQEEVENLKKKAELEKINKAKLAEEWASEKKHAVVPYTYAGIKKKPTNRAKKERQKPKKRDLYRKLEKGIASVWDSDSEDDFPKTEQDSLSNMLKRTRSGRVPKPTRAFNYTPPSSAEETEKQEVQDPNALENTNTLQPGSLMIVYSQTPTGEPTFKVFMVTPCQNKVPITLTPDMVDNLTKSANVPKVEVEQPPENNYTIAHDCPESDNSGTVPFMESTVVEPRQDEMKIVPEALDVQIYPFEQNVCIPVDETVALPEENRNLSSDGKYNIKLETESSKSELRT